MVLRKKKIFISISSEERVHNAGKGIVGSARLISYRII